MDKETLVTVKGAFGVSATMPLSKAKKWQEEQRKLEASRTKEEWLKQQEEDAKAMLGRLGAEKLRKLGISYTDEK